MKQLLLERVSILGIGRILGEAYASVYREVVSLIRPYGEFFEVAQLPSQHEVKGV